MNFSLLYLILVLHSLCWYKLCQTAPSFPLSKCSLRAVLDTGVFILLGYITQHFTSPRHQYFFLQVVPKADTNTAGSTAEWAGKLPNNYFSSEKYPNPFKLTQNNIAVSIDLSPPHRISTKSCDRAKEGRAA